MYNWRGQSQSNPQYTTLAGFCSIRTLFQGKTARVVYWGLAHSDSDSFNYTYIPLVWNFSQRLSYSHRVWGSPRWCPSGTCWTGRSTLSSGEAQERGEWKEREDVQKEKEGYFVWLEFLRVIFSVKIMLAETVCGRAIHKIFLRKIGTSVIIWRQYLHVCDFIDGRSGGNRRGCVHWPVRGNSVAEKTVRTWPSQAEYLLHTDSKLVYYTLHKTTYTP